MIKRYLTNLYSNTMQRAYGLARREIAEAHRPGSKILDCGAARGEQFGYLQQHKPITKDEYFGVEWEPGLAAEARSKGLNVIQGDLNRRLPFDDETFDCVYGLSVLEHLLMPCSWLSECKRVLKPGGRLVLLTPNIATYFTAFNILAGKMPSSGPHPDSNALNATQTYNLHNLEELAEGDTPAHRHLVVFSYKALRNFIRILGLDAKMTAFGYYPFPKAMQPMMERLDPYHCHQMVVVATKPISP
ncbi:class I SAM-dependent methyltransferase [Croceicoccus sp. BE223]|uniref:class I SAM-dependent methyltransferase n=1 Tax=Croceicoccus sp. BE223 TaxID=2817716 RepID=UPI0028558827|nr:class I SAM-dependent methyltransferase [Croceicoccus sp. BE223]MDR7103003.1 SAM-dependent methyltransferase [Croceicoccus sp. BE223]